jgi:hypothetical protein
MFETPGLTCNERVLFLVVLRGRVIAAHSLRNTDRTYGGKVLKTGEVS